MALVLLACSDQGPETTGAVRGTVRNSEGTSLPGVVVRALQVGSAAQQAVSAANGTFSLRDMRAGTWQLTYDGSDDYEDLSLPVTVEAGATVNVTMVIARRSYGAVSGTIRDAEGTSLAGVIVRASSEGVTAQEAVSAADGTFSFTSMRTGPWQLTYGGSVDYASTSVVVAVTAGATADVTMVVDLRGIIRGAIHYKDTDQPAAGVQVRLIRTGASLDTTTTSDGTFKFMHVAPGLLTLLIMPPAGYRGDTVAVAFNGAARSLPLVALVRVSGSVEGSVRSAGGGVSGVAVHITHMESNTQQTGTTRADGSFTIEGVPVGTVRLSVDPTPEAFAPPVVVSVQVASMVAPAIALLPRSALRPIAYVRCLEWERDWDDNEYCAHRQLAAVNSDGTGGRAVLDGAAGGVHPVDSRPSWSPDGQQLVFSSGSRQLHRIHVSGSGLVQLSTFTGLSTPVWSPDGDRILFTGTQPFSPLYFGHLPGFGITAVPNTEGAAEPALSPDGTRIAFAVGGVLKVVNTDGSGLMTLTSSGATHPTWSPDGKRIAFTHRGGNIGIIGANGGSPVSLGPGYCPEWSPDGSLIAAFGIAEPLYLDDVVVASLHLEDAISCTQAWSPAVGMLP